MILIRLTINRGSSGGNLKEVRTPLTHRLKSPAHAGLSFYTAGLTVFGFSSTFSGVTGTSFDLIVCIFQSLGVSGH